MKDQIYSPLFKIDCGQRLLLQFLFWILMGNALGCSAHRAVNKKNPFAGQNIKSISIPIFENQSVLPQVAGPFTQAIFSLLSEYKGLRVISGVDLGADAILLGTVSSDQRLALALKPTEGSTAKSVPGAESAIGEREDFIIPSKTQVSLGLNLVLIKGPFSQNTDINQVVENLKVATQEKGPEIIFETHFELQESFDRTLYGATSDGLRGLEVNATQNRGKVERSIGNLARKGADHLRELVLGVF